MRMTDVDICNMAIGYLGATGTIQLLTDTQNVNARRCNQFFKSTVEIVLREFAWSCVSKRVKLAQNTEDPEFEYTYQYELPTDCVFAIECYESTDWSTYDRWKRIQRTIQTDSDTLYLLYVAFPDDYQELDVMLADCIALKLAMRMAPAYMRDKDSWQLLSSAYQQALRVAKCRDTFESKEAFTPNSRYEDARVSEQA